jgi:hypothetical protein
MHLEIPIKMNARGDEIFKMPKEVHFGAKTLIKKTPVTWWPK